jgi:hypothetical protein
MESLGEKHAYVIMDAVYKQSNDQKVQNLAKKLFQESYDPYKIWFGPMHPDTLKAAQDLAQMWSSEKQSWHCFAACGHRKREHELPACVRACACVTARSHVVLCVSVRVCVHASAMFWALAYTLVPTHLRVQACEHACAVCQQLSDYDNLKALFCIYTSFQEIVSGVLKYNIVCLRKELGHTLNM